MPCHAGVTNINWRYATMDENMTITKGDVVSLASVVNIPEGELDPAKVPPAKPKTAEEHMAEFEKHDPLEGSEKLGRHIRDGAGRPSGSPANFEELRKAALTPEPEPEPVDLDAERKAIIDSLLAET